VLQGELALSVVAVPRVVEDRSGKLRCFVPLHEAARFPSEVR